MSTFFRTRPSASEDKSTQTPLPQTKLQAAESNWLNTYHQRLASIDLFIRRNCPNTFFETHWKEYKTQVRTVLYDDKFYTVNKGEFSIPEWHLDKDMQAKLISKHAYAALIKKLKAYNAHVHSISSCFPNLKAAEEDAAQANEYNQPEQLYLQNSGALPNLSRRF